MLAYTLALFPAALAPFLLGHAGWVYGAGAFAFGHAVRHTPHITCQQRP